MPLAGGDGVRLLDGDGRSAVGRRVGPVVGEVGHPDRRLRGDPPVHHRLRVRRLVPLVVPELAIAPQFDQGVAVEPLPKVDRQIDHLADGLRILAVDVEDRNLQHRRHVGRVGGRLGGVRRGGEPDLIVDHDVDGAADAVPLQLRHVERLGDDPLPGEGGVAVDEDRQRPGSPGVPQAILLGAHPPLHDGVHPLEVTGVEGEREVHLVLVGPLTEHAIDREAEVVLDVAAAVVEIGLLVQLVLELGEDLGGGLLEDVGQHVEPPAVGHPDHDLADAGTGCPFDQPLEQRDQALRPFQREALRAEELVLQELLEHLGADDLLKDLEAIGPGQRQPVPRALHPALQPLAQLEIVDVRGLHAHGAAVGFAQQTDQLTQRLASRPRDVLAAEHQVEVLRGEAVILERDLGARARDQPQRIEIGGEVAELAVGLDDSLHALREQAHRDAALDRAGRGRGILVPGAGQAAGEDAAGKRLGRNERGRAGAVEPHGPLELGQRNEQAPPLRIDAGRILEELEIELFGEGEVRRRQLIERRSGSRRLMHIQLGAGVRGACAVELQIQHVRHCCFSCPRGATWPKGRISVRYC